MSPSTSQLNPRSESGLFYILRLGEHGDVEVCANKNNSSEELSHRKDVQRYTTKVFSRASHFMHGILFTPLK